MRRSIRTPIMLPCLCALAALLGSACVFTYDFQNSADPQASNYEGFPTVADASSILAAKAFASPSDGSAVPVFSCSRVLGASSYQLQVAADSAFGGTLLLDAAASVNEVPAAGLLASLVSGTTYYWRMRANSGSWGAWTAAQSLAMTGVTGLSPLVPHMGAVGETNYASCSVTPIAATCSIVTWSSSNPKAIAVDATGKISYLQAGTVALITATSLDGGFTASNVATATLGTSIADFAGSGHYQSVDGAGAGASFCNVTSLCAVGGALYATGDYDIRRVDPAGASVTTVAGSANSLGSADGIGTSARFSTPQGICGDGTYLYVADTDNSTIRAVRLSDGEVTTLAGSAGNVGSVDGTGSTARFASPRGICTDGLNLYVVSAGGIRKIVIRTGQTTTLYNADCFRICTDGEALYYCGATYINKYDLETGVSTNLAGQGSGGDADGVGTAACFQEIQDIFVSGGELFVLDSWPSGIRVVKIDLATRAAGTIARFPRSLYPQAFCMDASTLYLGGSNAIYMLPLN